MRLLKLVIILQLLSITSAFSQSYIKDLQEASVILAKQFQNKGQKLKAVTLLSFCLELDEENSVARKFQSVINSNEEFRLYQMLPDNGREFSRYINRTIKENTDLTDAQVKYYAYIAKVLDPRSPTAKLTNNNEYFDAYKKHFPDYTPTEEEKNEIRNSSFSKDLLGKKPFDTAKNITINNFSYNPQKLLNAINDLNKTLKLYNIAIEIDTELIPYDEEKVENGSKAYFGPNLDVTSKNITFRKVTVFEILKYIEHTLTLTFHESDKKLIIREGQAGLNNRPSLFKKAETVMADTKLSTVKGRLKFDNKSAQIKGRITRIQAKDNSLLIQFNNHFVAEIDNKHLKDNTVSLLTEVLKSQKSNPTKANKMLNVSFRGVIKIRTTSRTDILNCSSIIAEDYPHFYLKH